MVMQARFRQSVKFLAEFNANIIVKAQAFPGARLLDSPVSIPKQRAGVSPVRLKGGDRQVADPCPVLDKGLDQRCLGA